MNTNNIPRLYGSKEFASVLGVTQQSLTKMKERGKLPAPIQVLAATAVWTEEQVMKKYGEYKKRDYNKSKVVVVNTLQKNVIKLTDNEVE